MIDVVVTLCLAAAGAGPCVERLVPAGAPDCTAALASAAPRLAAWTERYDVGEPVCRPAGGTPPLDVVEVAPGVHVHTGAVAEPDAENAGDVSNLVIVIGEARVAVIDAGGSRAVGERVVATVRSLTDLPIAVLVLTHMHPDHVFGATALADAGAEVVGHAALPEALGARADSYETAFRRLIGPAFAGSATPVPDSTVADSVTVDLGGRRLQLVAWPTAHTASDLTVWDEATGTLVAGDLVFDQHTPALDGSLTGWQAALEGIDALAPARVVPGHGRPSLPWPEGGADLRRYLDVLAADTRAAIRDGLTLGESVARAAASEADRWELFEAYNPRNATAAYTELEWE